MSAPLLAVLAISTLFDLPLRLSLPPLRDTEETKSTHQFRWSVLADPYVVLVVGLTLVAYSPRGVTISTVPKWLADVHSARQWQIGVIYTVSAICEFVVQLVLSCLISGHTARCVVLFVAFCIHTLGLVLMPYIPQVWYALLPLSLTRVGEGMYGSMVISRAGDTQNTLRNDYKRPRMPSSASPSPLKSMFIAIEYRN